MSRMDDSRIGDKPGYWSAFQLNIKRMNRIKFGIFSFIGWFAFFLTTGLCFGDDVTYGNKNIRKFSHPAVSTVNGCVDASCLQIGDGLKICKCLRDKETLESSFILYEGSLQKTQWRTEMNFQSDTSSFEALKCDLDGDGKKEIVVANFDGQSNGMGVTYWTISIINLQQPQTPLTFRVEDYGNGSIYWEEKEKRCNILATEWDWITDLKLGPGLYFIGKFFRCRSGVLEPIIDKKILSRRYLFSFAKERGDTLKKTGDISGAPLKWLTNRKTEEYKIDPIYQNFKGSSTCEGVIKEVTVNSDRQTLGISVLSGMEQIIQYVYPDTGDSGQRDIIERFAECKYGISYPSGYLPADPKTWLMGKEVVIKSHYDATAMKNHTLFLLKNCR